MANVNDARASIKKQTGGIGGAIKRSFSDMYQDVKDAPKNLAQGLTQQFGINIVQEKDFAAYEDYLDYVEGFVTDLPKLRTQVQETNKQILQLEEKFKNNPDSGSSEQLEILNQYLLARAKVIFIKDGNIVSTEKNDLMDQTIKKSEATQRDIETRSKSAPNTGNDIRQPSTPLEQKTFMGRVYRSAGKRDGIIQNNMRDILKDDSMIDTVFSRTRNTGFNQGADSKGEEFFRKHKDNPSFQAAISHPGTLELVLKGLKDAGVK